MPKRSLPTLPKTPLPTEQVGELTLYLGGKHGYKKVKLLEGGYQGYNNKRRLYTGTFHNARLAAIAIAQKEMDAECGTENVKSKKIIRTPCPKTIPLHLAHLLYCSSLSGTSNPHGAEDLCVGRERRRQADRPARCDDAADDDDADDG